MGKGDPLGNQTVKGGSDDMAVAQCANGVKSLLVSAVPENIGAFHRAAVVAGHLSIAVSLAARLFCSRNWFMVSMMAWA